MRRMIHDLIQNLRKPVQRFASPAFAGLFAALIFIAFTAWYDQQSDEFAVTSVLLFVMLVANAMITQRRDVALRVDVAATQQALHDQAKQLEGLAHKARKGSDAKSEFLAMMSHDLRTPMNAIVGYSSLLSETRLDDEQKTFVAVIMQACGNMLGLINDILDMTRLESGKMDVREAAYDPRDLLNSVARVIQVIAASRGSEIKIFVDPLLCERLMGDVGRLSQVLHNLAGNAAKFTHNGVITLSITAENAGGALRFTIADNGKGIPDDMKARLFQPFEQGENGRAAGKNSTGLGLAISDRIVRLLGGEIICHSESGIGTTFYFDLPMKVANDVVAETLVGETQSRDALRGRKVLIADDTPANLMLASAILEKCGMIVTTACDGASAIHAAQNQDFDIMFIDIQMPYHSGIEVASVIRTMAGPRAITPLVALTAQSFQRDRERALAGGFDAFLSKPIRAIDLETMANGLLADYPAGLDKQSHTMLNEAAFHDIADAIGADLLPQLIGRFERDVNEQLELIMRHHSAPDASQVTALAHKLSGLLSQFGADTPAQIAKAIETAEPHKRLPEDLEKLADASRACLRLIRTVLRARVESKAA